MNPSAWPELDLYPSVRELVRKQFDMQFADLRALLRLPLDDVEPNAGCNLTAATLAFNLIAGASVLFYKASLEALDKRARDRGERFKDVVEHYYPQEGETIIGDAAATALYYWTRNPLTHVGGVSKDRKTFPGAPEMGDTPIAVMLAKLPMSREAVHDLAHRRSRPEGLPATLTLHDNTLMVDVRTLAWGVHATYRALFDDVEQARAAERTAATLLGLPSFT